MPFDWLPTISKGDHALAHKRYTQAEALYAEAVQLAPTHFVPYERLGNFYYYTGRLDGALKHLLQAFELGSKDALVLFNLGRIYLLGQELFDRGRYFFERVLSISPNLEPLVSTYLGILLYLKGRPEESVEVLSRIRLATPFREPVEFFLGCSRCDIGKNEGAERHYQHALQLEPDNEETLLMLGNVQFRRKKYQDALASFERAISVKSDYAPAYQNVTVTLQFLGRPDEASAWMGKLRKIKRKSARRRTASVEEPGLERHIGSHLERLLFEGTMLRPKSREMSVLVPTGSRPTSAP